jgi:hypothetical protein
MHGSEKLLTSSSEEEEQVEEKRAKSEEEKYRRFEESSRWLREAALPVQGSDIQAEAEDAPIEEKEDSGEKTSQNQEDVCRQLQEYSCSRMYNSWLCILSV